MQSEYAMVFWEMNVQTILSNYEAMRNISSYKLWTSVKTNHLTRKFDYLQIEGEWTKFKCFFSFFFILVNAIKELLIISFVCWDTLYLYFWFYTSYIFLQEKYLKFSFIHALYRYTFCFMPAKELCIIFPK